MGQASGELRTYLCLDCAKNVDKNWNITVSFIIHVNFDHAWAEHYPITLSQIGIYVTPRLISIPKSHWLADSLASASGRRTPDGPPPVTTAPCLRSLTVVEGIKQGEILGRSEQYKHAHSIYTVHDEIQEVISYTMFPVRYI